MTTARSMQRLYALKQTNKMMTQRGVTAQLPTNITPCRIKKSNSTNQSAGLANCHSLGIIGRNSMTFQINTKV